MLYTTGTQLHEPLLVQSYTHNTNSIILKIYTPSISSIKTTIYYFTTLRTSV